MYHHVITHLPKFNKMPLIHTQSTMKWCISLMFAPKVHKLKPLISNFSANFENDPCFINSESWSDAFLHMHSELTCKLAVWLHTYPRALTHYLNLNNIFVNFENVMFKIIAQSTISEFFKWHVWNGYSVTMKLCISFICRQRSLANMVITHLSITWTFE